MQYCSIVPVNNLKLMYEDTSMVMLLAHLADQNKEYSKMARNFKGYKIMDNSIIELGNSFSLNQLIDNATICRADEIILPDVFMNGKETIKKAKECIKFMKKKGMISKFKLMVVCHARNYKEFERNFKKLEKIKEIHTIGIPKVLTTWCGSRTALESVYLKSKKEIHFLGCWENLWAELGSMSPASKKKVRSLDTCFVALYTKYDRSLILPRTKEMKLDLEKDTVNEEKYKVTYGMLKGYMSVLGLE